MGWTAVEGTWVVWCGGAVAGCGGMWRGWLFQAVACLIACLAWMGMALVASLALVAWLVLVAAGRMEFRVWECGGGWRQGDSLYGGVCLDVVTTDERTTASRAAANHIEEQGASLPKLEPPERPRPTKPVIHPSASARAPQTALRNLHCIPQHHRTQHCRLID